MSLKAHPDTIETKTGQTPRKIVAGYFLSLDGVAEAPDRFITAWDDETDASGANLIATQDAVILGRRSYDEWAAYRGDQLGPAHRATSNQVWVSPRPTKSGRQRSKPH
jgi:hypothetical protein